MKKQAFNPYLPSYEYVRTESPMYLGIGCMCLAAMTLLMEKGFA